MVNENHVIVSPGVDFREHFWGEKPQAGFEVLFHNYKEGSLAVKDLLDFLRERAKVEEAICHQYTKLVPKIGAYNHGSFAPVWQIVKASMEKLAASHSRVNQQCLDLVKDVSKYSEDLHKASKQVKDEEQSAQASVSAMVAASTSLAKLKDAFNQRLAEVEKLKESGASTGGSSNPSQKDMDKAEVKYRKVREEYRQAIDKFNVLRESFVEHMVASYGRFQSREQQHLMEMHGFLDSYVQTFESLASALLDTTSEFRAQQSQFCPENLMQMFVQTKDTGQERPVPAVFQETSNASPVKDLMGTSSPSANNSTPHIPPDSNMASTTGAALPTVTFNPVKKELTGGTTRSTVNKRMTTSLLNLFNASNDKTDKASTAGSAGDGSPGSTASVGGAVSAPPNSAGATPPGFLRSKRKKKEKKKQQQMSTSASAGIATDLQNQMGTSSLTNSPSITGTGLTGVGSGISFLDNLMSSESSKTGNLVSTSPPSATSTVKSSATGSLVDDEGFSIKPTTLNRGPDGTTKDLDKFYSSSDTDSDDSSEDLRDKRIHVEIKPLSAVSPTGFSASVDELSASVQSIRLPPPSSASVSQGLRSHTATPPITSAASASMFRSQSLGGKTDLVPSSAEGGFSEPVSPHKSSAVPSAVSKIKSKQEILDLFSPSASVDTPPILPPKMGSPAKSDSPGPPKGLAPVLSSTAIPRPHSSLNRMGTTPSPSSDSVSSLSEFKTTNLSVGSRGPSPLTLSRSDRVPIAVAFQEVVHAYFRGTDESLCRVKREGNLVMSFPAGIVPVLTSATHSDPTPLVFRVKNAARLSQIVCNSPLVAPATENSPPSALSYAFSMPNLTQLLRTQAEANPRAAYFNVDILKYQIKTEGGPRSAPFHLVSYWKCEASHTDLRIDYKYNPAAWPPSAGGGGTLLNVGVSVPVQGGVTKSHFKPEGEWRASESRALWRISELSSRSDNAGAGTLRARFELSHGPGTSSSVACQFNADGSTLSGADFELVGPGYRVSLLKKRFKSGKYICDADPGGGASSRYAAPPVAPPTSASSSPARAGGYPPSYPAPPVPPPHPHAANS